METRRCVIRGRVQGVGFRYYVMRNAKDLGVRGSVRNCSDGAVEAILQAPSPGPLDQLIDRLRKGPSAARVEEVLIDTIEDDSKEYEGFELEW
jgi:acylphosphatase